MKKSTAFLCTALLSHLILPFYAYAKYDVNLNPCPNTVEQTNRVQYSAIALKLPKINKSNAYVSARCTDDQSNVVIQSFDTSHTSPQYSHGISNVQNIRQLIIMPTKGKNRRKFIIDQRTLINKNGKTCTLVHKSAKVPVQRLNNPNKTRKKKITFFRCKESGWPNPIPSW